MTVRICLRGMNAPVEGLCWTFDRPFRVGRLNALELPLPSNPVSRFHAEIRPDRFSTWLLEDQGSTNGTFLNGVRLGSLAQPLRHHDLIQFSDVVLQVEAINEPGHPSPRELIEQAQGDSPDALAIRRHLLWCSSCREGSPMYVGDHPLRTTEREWWKGTFPSEMLTTLLSDRKKRLFAVACARSIEHLLRQDRSREAIAVAEAFSDGMASEQELAAAFDAACKVVRQRGGAEIDRAAAQTAAANASVAAETVWRDVVAAVGRAELRRLADCLRDIAGSPFEVIHPIDPGWLIATSGSVGKMARVIYDERRFHVMPILADALEDAGCTMPSLLVHCRQRAPHWRGCWVLDLLTGKG